jgi:hypothetical protein
MGPTKLAVPRNSRQVIQLLRTTTSQQLPLLIIVTTETPSTIAMLLLS